MYWYEFNEVWSMNLIIYKKFDHSKKKVKSWINKNLNSKSKQNQIKKKKRGKKKKAASKTLPSFFSFVFFI